MSEKNLRIQTAVVPPSPQVAYLDLPLDAVYRNIMVQAQMSYNITTAGAAGSTANQKIRATLKATSGKRRSYGNIVSAMTLSMYTLGTILSESGDLYVHEVAPSIAATGNVNGIINFPISFEALKTNAIANARLNSTELTSLRLELQFPDWSDGTAVGTRSGIVKAFSAGRYVLDDISYMYPNFNEITVPANQANSAYQVDLKRGLPLRGILVSTIGYATDTPAVINRLTLRRNQDAVIDLDWSDLVAINAYGGNVGTGNSNAVFIDFCESTIFGDLLTSQNVNDLTLLIDMQGVNNSSIYIMPVEMVPAGV